MRELDDMDGFRIGGTVVNNLRYADDTGTSTLVCILRKSVHLRCKM